MKNQKIYQSIAVFVFAFFLILGKPGEEVQAQSVDKETKKEISPALVDEIKSTLKAKENSWIFEKEHNSGDRSQTVWKRRNKQITVDITKHETAAEAIEYFDFIGDSRYIAVHVPVKVEKGFADEAMLRITNLHGGSTINFCFRQEKYTVSIWGKEKDARRFAAHVLAVINAQKNSELF